MYHGVCLENRAEIVKAPLTSSPLAVHTRTLRVGKPIRLGWPTLPPKFASKWTMTSPNDLNLTTHRAPVSVWERRGWDGTRQQLAITRWLLGIGGGALAIQGLRQRSVLGSTLAGLGGTLAWWALTGEGDLSDARRWFTSVLERAGWAADDLIGDASAESFPASDPPASSAAVGTGLRHRGAMAGPAGR